MYLRTHLTHLPIQAADKLQLALGQLDSVISTRLIYTGSAAEGPASFYTKGGQVVFP